MPDLTSLQAWIARQLVKRRALYKDENIVAESSEHLTGNERLLPVEQLEIYREQFWLRHTEAMLEDFPGVSGILGQSTWEGLVESYLERYLPDSFSLRDLGGRFSEHIALQHDLPHGELCQDMAKLEWAYVEIFDAADAPALDGAKLAALPEEAWARATIVFNPALQLLRTRYPVAELRRQLKAKPEQALLIPAAEARHYVLYRGKDLSIFYEDIGPAAFTLMEALLAGTPLVKGCEELAAAYPVLTTLDQDVGAWFSDWARRGWVVDVNDPGAVPAAPHN